MGNVLANFREKTYHSIEPNPAFRQDLFKLIPLKNYFQTTILDTSKNLPLADLIMANINGSWLGTYWQWGNPTRFELSLIQGGNTLTGNILDDSNLGEASVIGEIIGRKITFTKQYLNSRHTVNYTGIVLETEDFMTGEWTISNFDSGKWEAVKNKDELDLNAELRRYQKVPVSV